MTAKSGVRSSPRNALGGTCTLVGARHAEPPDADSDTSGRSTARGKNAGRENEEQGLVTDDVVLPACRGQDRQHEPDRVVGRERGRHDIGRDIGVENRVPTGLFGEVQRLGRPFQVVEVAARGWTIEGVY